MSRPGPRSLLTLEALTIAVMRGTQHQWMAHEGDRVPGGAHRVARVLERDLDGNRRARTGIVR